MKDKNSPLIKYSKLFNRQRKTLPIEIKIAFLGARELFLENSNHPSLRDHALRGNLAGYRIIDITDDYRAVYKRKLDGDQDVITFHTIGTHEELYGKYE